MSFQSTIDQDIKSAMLAREAAKLNVLRMLKSSLMNAAIEKGGAGTQLDDLEALAIVRKEIKKRHDSIESFEKGGRPEMAEIERSEIAVLVPYLPQQMTASDIEVLVRNAISEAAATSRQHMGAVMKIVNAKAAGQADGKSLSAEVQRQLAAL